ncbi:hypothetical protein DC498_14055 [Terrimonas sp.]|uniref:nucleotidyl transferase AbiEii/AbiGii toxin family protein n=1 Tax=Terrimonas sp. TaxID=1914338 RepID=UPI000D52261C|nr:nucleotidyl transferase AbiEii/AbiGii toxin family protein [Terrimonas sp.]PVD51543.1 hypothetical protein DC498_14055 [Terrimonas sp.]
MLKHINDKELEELFALLGEVFHAHNIDYYLIGAIARDYWYKKGQLQSRISRDVDFAVLIPAKKEYEQVRTALQQKGFTETRQNAFVLISPSGIQIDLLPFGDIEIDDSVVLEGEGMTSIKVNGFKEVYQAGTEETDIADKYSFKAATLSSIVLLKLISYDDRPERRAKDPRDIAGIIRDFFHLQSDLIYNHHSDLFITEEELELTDIAAMVIGREMKKVCVDNHTLCTRIKNILADEIKKGQASPFLRRMQEETSFDIEMMKIWLEKLLKGFSQ